MNPGTSAGETTGDPQVRQPAAPSISLPRGGGAIRGLGEKFATNPVTGTASMSVPIATSPGRSGFGPKLTLSYDSGAGNGPFGFGWSLSAPSVTRKTDKGLPRYHDAVDPDIFMLSDVDDLVPVLAQDAGGNQVPEPLPPKTRTVAGQTYRIRRYRPRIEGLFARIESWTNTGDATDMFWRCISRGNVTTWYGKTPESRITDPMDASRIFSWLICESHDDKGNVIVYGYKAEDSARIFEDANGQVTPRLHERNRSNRTRSAQRYLKSIRYGNRMPYLPVLKADAAWPEPPAARLTDDANDAWLFEAVFDYGDHDASTPTPRDAGVWPARRDPFSSCRAGFEVRTYRICQRVLMFHHFPDEPGVGRDCLVRSTDFGYSDEADPANTRNPIYTFLKAVTQTGYRRHDGGYDNRSLPPVQFEYSEPVVQAVVEEVDPASLDNLPVGLDGSAYRWTDLHGEGVPGILAGQAGAWFYKRNRSPLGDAAQFAPTETVALTPNLAWGGEAGFMDLAGDGQPDVVVMDGPTPGLYEHDDAEGWQSFRPFTARLNRDFRDPNLRLVDLDGDGRADVLVTEDDAFVWHASLAEEGFAGGQRVAQALDEEKGPRLVFSDGTQSIYLADMSGDGLSDLVRIRNSEICYWPNLGYCRFGARVTMTFQDQGGGSACFDHGDQFDHKRLRLADIDGSGNTDIIYLHRDGVRLYFNQSGNGWSQPHHLKVFPRIDASADVVPIDLLGNGTASLVWSSPLPGDARRPMRYVNLMGKRKPHLLVGTTNNLGAETRVHYAPSTRFYLRDKRDGNPWITRLPFPVHVVERVETWDHISRNRFVTQYIYHHGYFDGDEREFRGFGMVEQQDTELFAALTGQDTPAENIDGASHVPPIRTRTWFHTGACPGRERVSRHYEGEYFREPGQDPATAQALLLEDTILPPGLSLAETREACRALRGMMLRQEIYAMDGTGTSPEYPFGMPYTVTEQNFGIRRLQARGSNPHAVFFTHSREAITYHYERMAADPRVQHALTLEVDDYGNVLRQAAIGYGRRVSPLAEAWDHDRQTTALMTGTENAFTNAIDDQAKYPDDYRSPQPGESRTYELTGIAGGSERLTFRQVFDDTATVAPLRYEEPPIAGSKQKRLIGQVRILYRPDDCGVAGNDPMALLPHGELQRLALPGERYRLALTPGLLDQVFRRPRPGQADELLLPEPERAAILAGQAGDQCGYVDLDGDGNWWMPSGRSFHHPANVTAQVELAEASAHFFLPRRYRDPFGQDTVVTFDGPADPAKPKYDLLMVETRDALGNRVTVDANDYRVLQPRLVGDPNGNQTEMAFDTLGMVVGTAVMGKPDAAPVEGDTLGGFITDLSLAQLDPFTNAPRQPSAGPGQSEPTPVTRDLLHGATARIVYDLDRFQRLGEPAFAATIARETHVSDLAQGQESRLRISFSYSDGFGREIQKRIQAEPGPLDPGNPNAAIVNPRWVCSGWTVFNNKGKPVRQYEPFFDDTHAFRFAAVHGVSPVLLYDPAERVVAILHPNHTFQKVVFDPWQQTSWDVNDTCAPPLQQPGDPPPRETGDPRTDPDIGALVAGYFRTQPAGWQTWHAQRIGGAMGPDEQNAAQRAAAHADTRTTTHFDALGRAFLTVARHRVRCAGHPLDGMPDEEIHSRVDLDIQGNQRQVFDERRLPDADNLPQGALEQRIVMRYAYNMLGNRVHHLSMEAGARWMLGDVAGKSIRVWDSRGHNFATRYDALRRPIEQFVRGTFSDPDPLKPNSDPRTLNPPGAAGLLVARIEYGEPPPDGLPAQETQARRLNLRGRIYRQSDSAGIVTHARLDDTGKPVEAYDFKGNLLRSTRQLVSDYKAIPDWLQNPQLTGETFEGGTHYDAVNRPVQSIAPHSSPGGGKFHVVQPVYNDANLLERVHAWLDRMAEPAALLDPGMEAPSPVGVSDIRYDARGQRTLVDYKTADTTVIRTTYAYDRETFRLTHLYTRRGVDAATSQGVAFSDDCENPNQPPPPTVAAPGMPPAGKGCGLQNLHYTCDPVGNITHIRDDAQQTVYFRNQRVEPGNDYVYDALYRLVQADGREHLGQLAGGDRLPPTAPDAFNAFHIRHDQPNDRKAMGTYTEQYVYDAVGNFLRMQHRGTDPAHAGWTRAYSCVDASLIEPGKPGNRLSRTTLNPAGSTPQPETYLHDAHGNMLRMPHLTRMDWDYGDRLLATSRQVVNDAPPPDSLPQTTYYVHDATGQRVRTVCEKAAGLIEERIYLGGFEIFRRHGGAIGANSTTLERETLHVMDGRQRIALVELRTLGNEPGVPQRLIRYQFGNHLGSSSLELDELAQIISYEEYAPYGSSTYQAVRSQTETAKRYRYAGKERDEESGLYYHGARYFAPWIGSWCSPDPELLVDGPNLFRYCQNNPVLMKDPGGTDPETATNPDPRNFKSFEDYRAANQGESDASARQKWQAAYGKKYSIFYDSTDATITAQALQAAKDHGVTAHAVEPSQLSDVIGKESPDVIMFFAHGYSLLGTMSTGKHTYMGETKIKEELKESRQSKNVQFVVQGCSLGAPGGLMDTLSADQSLKNYTFTSHTTIGHTTRNTDIRAAGGPALPDFLSDKIRSSFNLNKSDAVNLANRILVYRAQSESAADAPINTVLRELSVLGFETFWTLLNNNKDVANDENVLSLNLTPEALARFEEGMKEFRARYDAARPASTKTTPVRPHLSEPRKAHETVVTRPSR